MSYLVFPDLASAQTRNDQLGAALGYPDSTGIYTYYCTPDQHPTNSEAALIITRVCATDATPYYVKDAVELLTQPERDSLQSWEALKAAGWWPEEP